MGSYHTYSSLVKLQALVPEFVMEDLPSAELQTSFLRLQWRTCPWEEHSDDDYFQWMNMKFHICLSLYVTVRRSVIREHLDMCNTSIVGVLPTWDCIRKLLTTCVHLFEVSAATSLLIISPQTDKKKKIKIIVLCDVLKIKRRWSIYCREILFFNFLHSYATSWRVLCVTGNFQLTLLHFKETEYRLMFLKNFFLYFSVLNRSF